MRILMVAPDIRDFFPIGISYVVAALKNAGHEVDGLNLHFEKNWDKGNWGKYDFVATGGLACSFNDIKQVVNKAKCSKTKVIVGGGMVTSEPELITGALDVDYSVIGEGEKTVVDLLRCIENNIDIESVPGVGFKKNGEYIFTAEREAIKNLDLLPLPDYESLGFSQFVDKMKSSDRFYDIFDYPRAYPLVGSRSCPFLCTFCYHTTGRKYRKRSVDSIIEELRVAVPKYRINIIEVMDELFSYDEKRVREFCEKFKAFASTVPWNIKWFANFRVDKLKEEMLDMVKDAGCFLIGYGFESYSPKILKSMRKHITPEQIHRAIHSTIERKISIQGNFIFGDVAETEETAEETLKFWEGHPEAGIFLLAALPFPDSELWRYCIKKGIVKDKLDYILTHFFDPPNMTTMPDAKYHKLWIKMYKTMLKHHVSTIPLSVKDDSITVKCPWCGEVTKYENYDICSEIHAAFSIGASSFFYNKPIFCRNCRLRFWITSRFFKLFKILLHSIIYSWTAYRLLRKIKSVLKKFLNVRKIIWDALVNVKRVKKQQAVGVSSNKVI